MAVVERWSLWVKVGVLYDNFCTGVQHVYCAKLMPTKSRNDNPTINGI